MKKKRYHCVWRQKRRIEIRVVVVALERVSKPSRLFYIPTCLSDLCLYFFHVFKVEPSFQRSKIRPVVFVKKVLTETRLRNMDRERG